MFQFQVLYKIAELQVFVYLILKIFEGRMCVSCLAKHANIFVPKKFRNCSLSLLLN